jgi:CRP/FNR family transcriptional regulator, anaerobic regulatory protein
MSRVRIPKGRLPTIDDMNDIQAQRLLSLYPSLAAREQTLTGLPVITVPQGTVLFRENDPCQGFPLVLDGEVRVSRASPSGRELELYRVQPGEMCLVSSAGLPESFRMALEDAGFRDFVLGLFAARMADLTGLIEAVAFQRLDSRLAATLLGHGAQVRVTHQSLADELGTVREMVTRLLHRFEREGMVELSRECITIRNSARLRAVAAGPAGAV